MVDGIACAVVRHHRNQSITQIVSREIGIAVAGVGQQVAADLDELGAVFGDGPGIERDDKVEGLGRQVEFCIVGLLKGKLVVAGRS